MGSASPILVVGPSWAGDMVMAQSLFKALKRRDPEASVEVLAPGWSKPLLARMPEVDAAIEMPLGHGRLGLAERWRLGHSLRNRGYSQAILLPNSLKSALVPFWARIPLRTGWIGELRYGLLNDARRLDKQRWRMTVQRFVALAQPAGEHELPEIEPPALQVDPAERQRALQALGLKKGERPLLALCPGAEFGPSKRWPEAHYAELANHYLSQGWQVWLFGADKDQPACAEIDRLSDGACVDLAGRTTLAQAVDLLSLADAVVSNDSGLMHVAAALDRRLVAVYGSTDPGFTPPLNSRSKVVRLGLDCSPCFQRECPKGHLDCLNRLPVESVIDALEALPR
ncbi:lipopolysaccharide heptosyltransferase II [endosymbiont of Riftia pachyptila]|uniref:lipopolysaccharide heptosyltransferase II n=1 Tax=endosymbiont of Riftia pachyptila (vent Ph05) TaxID=1048808 RepID=G2DCD3_9GAMM|nr:lipopolysaccharide heptosyltransferase II [endosymbiont of Riftia pachyptila]EGV51729.1 ADP-heptose--LPS heptosyltransferase 2 [endosymbiont of Riftia pachyptila (vent Ph05)]